MSLTQIISLRSTFRVSARALFSSLVLVLLMGSQTAWADGLFYQLPADGSSVVFDLKMKADAGGEEREGGGSLTMSSVGQAEVDGEKARWIEFKMVMQMGEREQTIIAKTLVPEKHLKLGENPFANFSKAWLKQGDRDPKEIKEAVGNDAGPLPAFLSGPLNNKEELEAVEVESGLGKLKCRGVTGDLELDEGNQKIKIAFENRLHNMAPFGVVTSKMKFKVTRDGEAFEGGTLNLSLKEVGTNAKSELPDLN